MKELVTLLQVGVEITLLILLLVVLWRTRGGLGDKSQPAAETPPELVPKELTATVERFLAESEKIAKAFEANLEDKKKLSADLILKLDRRLADYQDLLARTEEALKEGEKRLSKLAEGARGPGEREGPNPAAPETRAQVLRLAKKGLSVEEIAVKSNLLRGEVELIINLEKDFTL
ncbi:MAG: DUF2802 domain-containing protein [Deltaproteobacteria bacterium]|jgi:DNA-binding NarL/FixJ family response regulator|nr:DUF2802 domain-containing protein [Deltaproteobacteria bacterium]